MPLFGGDLGEGEAGTQRRRGTCYRQTPQGLTGTWVQAEGDKGGGGTGVGTAVDAGMRRGVQGKMAEAGVWQMGAATRWAALCTGRGGGERVKQEVFDEEWLRLGRR